MIVRYARNSHKEYDMFMEYIMWNRENQKVLYLYSTKKRKQEYITKIFNWVDKKHIKEIIMWGKSSSIYKIIITNFCGKTIEIKFKKQKPITNNRVCFVDDIQQQLKNKHKFDYKELNEFYESYKKRRNEK